MSDVSHDARTGTVIARLTTSTADHGVWLCCVA